MSKIIAVSLATASVPEEHCTRLRLTRFVARTFKYMVGAQMEAAAVQQRAQLSKAARVELQIYKNAVSARALTALFDFLDHKKLGFVTLADLCCLLVRCNYGHVPHAMLAEVWALVDRAGTGGLRRDELHEFIGIRLLLKKKREDLDSYLEMLDTDDTGYVSLEKINEALEAFGQEALSPSEQTEIISQYCLHSQLDEYGQMEWWRLADILQYSLMNCLLRSS